MPKSNVPGVGTSPPPYLMQIACRLTGLPRPDSAVTTCTLFERLPSKASCVLVLEISSEYHSTVTLAA
jgi:hypothetical protein